MRPGRQRSGFTLVEVLIALAIFAMTAIVLGSAYLNVLNSYAIVGKQDKDAPEVAFCRQELIAQPDFQTAENGDEYTTVDGRTVQWSAAIDDQNLTTVNLYHVVLTVEITDTSSSNPRTLTREFYLLRPTWGNNNPSGADMTTKQQSEASRIAVAQGRQQS
ncbi:MAG TPA: prepilin-type N-terminal cleavage/methylation domain-containing protein [Opitutaceae bacterium]|nr:prepilin-type N-terminal cleavage/methylation domain-containing protein [Opitutaceae bacterium]